MRVVSTELRKLFSNKMFLLIIAAVFVLNGYLMVRTANSGNAKPSDYKEVYSELEGLSDIEKLDWLDERIQEYSGQHSYNFEVLHELHEECYNVVHYKDYIDNIDAQAKSMTSISIFAQKGTFNYRNIQKTPPAYDNMCDVKPEFDISEGILLATDNGFTDILSGFILLFALLLIMISDREQGMSALLFSLKRGRGYLLTAKIIALAITILVSVALICTENLIISAVLYGLGDLSRPIQSVSGFLGCNIRISVSVYLILYLLFKFLALFLIGMILTLIAVNTKNTVSFFGLTAVVLITEGMLYQKIEPLSIYSIFRYVNIISFTKVNDIFCTYKNINFWEYPVPLIPTVLMAIAVISAVCILLSIIIYIKKRNLEFRRLSSKLHLFKGQRVHSKVYYTFFKSLVFQKGIFVIIVFIFVYSLLNDSFIKKYDIIDVYYTYYADELEGDITQETLDYCESEDARFNEINACIAELQENSAGYSAEVDELQKKLAPSMGFYPMRDRITEIKDQPNAQVFYDTGYKRAFGIGGYDDDMKYALVTMLMCIFLVSPLIANDNKYRMSFVINSTRSGRKSYIRRNILVSSVYGIIASLLWIIPYAKLINDYYGHSGLLASVRSITDFTDFPVNMTVLQYALMVTFLRIFFVTLSALMMLWISSKCRNTTTAILINFAVFALPIIIYLFGAKMMVNIGFTPLLSVNVLINSPSYINLLLILLVGIIIFLKRILKFRIHK